MKDIYTKWTTPGRLSNVRLQLILLERVTQEVYVEKKHSHSDVGRGKNTDGTLVNTA